MLTRGGFFFSELGALLSPAASLLSTPFTFFGIALPCSQGRGRWRRTAWCGCAIGSRRCFLVWLTVRRRRMSTSCWKRSSCLPARCAVGMGRGKTCRALKDAYVHRAIVPQPGTMLDLCTGARLASSFTFLDKFFTVRGMARGDAGASVAVCAQLMFQSSPFSLRPTSMSWSAHCTSSRPTLQTTWLFRSRLCFFQEAKKATQH